MDIVKSDVDVTVPRAVKDLLDEPVTDVKDIALTGPMPSTSARRAVSLSPRAFGVRGSSLGLTAAKTVAPDEKSADYDSFFDAEPAPKSFGLGGAQRFNGANRYPSGAMVDLGGGVMGKVVGPTSNTTTPAGWFTSAQSVNKTYVQTPSGTIRELTSTNGSEPDQRFLNQYDIQAMSKAAKAEVASPANAQREADFRKDIAASNDAASQVVKTADTFPDKYGTAQGLATNVVLPVATAGVAAKAGEAVQGSLQGGKGYTEATIAQTRALAENGIQSAGNTAQFFASRASDKGGGAAAGLDIGTNAIAATMPGNPYVGAAQSALNAATSEGVNAGGGGFDASNTTIAVATGALGGAANTLLPGSGVAVQVAGDGAQVGANSVEMQNANYAVEQSSNAYYAPRKEANNIDMILQNATFDESNGYPTPSQGASTQPQQTQQVATPEPVQTETPVAEPTALE